MPDTTTSTPAFKSLFDAPWQQRLKFIVETMREMSRQSDPQIMVSNYYKRMNQLLPTDGWLSLTRRVCGAGGDR